MHYFTCNENKLGGFFVWMCGAQVYFSTFIFENSVFLGGELS